MSECTDSDEKFKAYMKSTFNIEGNDFKELFDNKEESIKISAKKLNDGQSPYEYLKNDSDKTGQVFEFKRYGEKIVPQFIELHRDISLDGEIVNELYAYNFAVKYDDGLKVIFPKVETEAKLTVDSRLDLVNFAMDVKQEKGAVINLLKSDQQGPLYLESLFFKETIDQLCDFKKKDLFSKDPEDIDHFRAHMEELLEHKIGPLMAKTEFKQDMAAIGVLSESLGKVSNDLAKGKNSELKAKVDEKIGTLNTYKNLNNEINSNKVKKIASYATAFIFAAAFIAIPLVVTFPPALAILAVIVPVICAVSSIVLADKGYKHEHKENIAKSDLSGEGLRISDGKSAECCKSGSFNKVSVQGEICSDTKSNDTKLGAMRRESSPVAESSNDDSPFNPKFK